MNGGEAAPLKVDWYRRFSFAWAARFARADQGVGCRPGGLPYTDLAVGAPSKAALQQSLSGGS